MKTCYIANCDRSCNFDNSRSMFLTPSSGEVFAKWVNVIPENKRPLTRADRLCERHFLESEIDKYWIHTINGEVTKMIRDRPKLKSKNVVPSQNLHIVLEKRSNKVPTKRKSDANGEKKILKKVKTEKCLKIVEKVILSDPKNLFEDENISENEPIFVEVQTTDQSKSDEDPPQIKTEEKLAKKEERILILKKGMDKKRREDFEALYEEIFAVQLPSQLWGIHRCPDQKFMAFSRFDTDSLKGCDLLVRITDLWQYTVYYKGLKVKQDMLSIMTEDSVSVLLDEIDSNKYSLTETDQVLVKRKYTKRY